MDECELGFRGGTHIGPGGDVEGIHGHGALDVRHAQAPVGEVEGEIDGLGLGNLLDGPKCTIDLGPPVLSFFLARLLLFFFS